MIRLLKELWPAILPLLLYAAWMLHKRKHAVRQGEHMPRWVEGPWFWAVMASIVVAVACLLSLGASEKSIQGAYVPPHMQNGQLVPGRIGSP